MSINVRNVGVKEIHVIKKNPTNVGITPYLLGIVKIRMVLGTGKLENVKIIKNQ